MGLMALVGGGKGAVRGSGSASLEEPVREAGGGGR